MSDLQRLKRIVKSLIPRIPRKSELRYDYGDARLMINDLALDLSPQTLSYLVNNDMVLEDFINSIYDLEHQLRRQVTTRMNTIDPELLPKVYEESNSVTFTVKFDGDEWIFAEYTIS